MKTIFIVMLACVASPALADVYKCNSGGKSIYQDAPCPNAKVIDNINSQAPSRVEQMRAMERAARDQALVKRLNETRAAESSSVTSTQTTVRPNPAPMTNRPDKYYDHPDRYDNRSTSSLSDLRPPNR